MRVEGVTEALDLARAATGVDRVRVKHKPRLLSDKSPCYAAKDLAAYLEEHGLGHTPGRPYHPMTQGKIEPPKAFNDREREPGGVRRDGSSRESLRRKA
jgi:putative transposase